MSRLASPRGRALLLVAAVASLLPGLAGDTTHSAFSSSNANGSNAFAGAAEPFGGTCSTPVTPVWLTGVEHGIGFTSGAGIFVGMQLNSSNVTADSTIKRSGNYSLKFAKTNGGGGAYGTASYATTTVAVARFSLYMPTLPSASNAMMLSVQSGVTQIVNFRWNSSLSKFELVVVGGTARASATTISAATWYTIDIRVNVAANPRTADWRINGVAQTQATYAATATTVNATLFGSNNGTDAFTGYYDDMVLSSTSADYPMPDMQVGILRPNGIGTNVNAGAFQDDDNSAVDAASSARIDDVPMNTLTDYVKQVSVDTSAYVEVAMGDPGAGCIQGVRALVTYHSSGTTANSAQTQVVDGSTTTVVYNGDMSESVSYVKGALVPRSSWTAGDLSNVVMRIGFASNVATIPYWDALGLEYAFSAASAGAPSCSPATQAPAFITGYEHGVVSTTGGTTGAGLYSAVTTTGGTVAADSTVARHGTYSLKVAKTGGSGAASAEEREAAVVSRFAVRLADVPASTVEIARVTAASGADELQLEVTAAGRFQARFGTGTAVTGTVPVQADRWHVIDLRVTYTTNPRTAEWRIDEIAQAQASLATTTSSVNTVRFGSDVAAHAFTAWYDDVIMSSTSTHYPFGDGKVLALSPTGTGTNQTPANFQNDDNSAIGAGTAGRLDEVPLNANTATPDYVKQVTASASDVYVELTFPDPVDTCLNGMSGIVAYHQSVAGTAAGQTRFTTSDTAASGGTAMQSGMNSTAYAYAANTYSPCCTNANLTMTVARIGWATAINPMPYWDAVMIEYDVKTP